MEKSYLSTMILLILHQIDAAYWQEWQMFLLPGGVQGFLLFNLLILPIVLLGYRSVIINDSHAKSYAYICAGLGLLTVIIHSGFFLKGYEQFNLPFSLVILLLCLISSCWQLIIIRRVRLN